MIYLKQSLVLILAATVGVASAQVSYKQIATGQIVCYGIDGEVIGKPEQGKKLHGQDANYMRGAKMSYTDNGDGTITDNNSGLVWQQTPPVQGTTWDEAVEYCEKLELGGYTDWRLPTLKELFSISDFSQGWPYLDTLYFKLAGGVVSKDQQYWSSHKYAGETVEGRNNAAFGVNHVTGHIKAYPAGGGQRGQGEQMRQRPPQQGNQQGMPQRPPQGGDSLQRRAQRPPQGGDSLQRRAQRPPQQMSQQGGRNMPPRPGGQHGAIPMGNPAAKQLRAVRGEVYGINDFVDNSNGTITDKATGLMWSKSDNGKGITWVEALKYAEGAELAGYTDWRLPNVKELQGIVDYQFAPKGDNIVAAIDPIFSCTPFINEAGHNDYGYYWTGTSACFRRGEPYYFAWYVAFGRAVNSQGLDFHGAGAVRFDSKTDNGLKVEGGEERYYNFVRLVRDVK